MTVPPQDRPSGRAGASGPDAPGGAVCFHRLPHGADLPLPSRATTRAAGYDVRSAEPAFTLDRGEIRLVATGLSMALPDGVECQVRPRSGLAVRHGVTLPNSPGTIDPDYRGELKVPLQNLGPAPVRIERGERIAQLVFARFETLDVVEVETADELGATGRGAGGFGSTGRA